MQEPTNDWPTIPDRPPSKKSRTRSIFFRFLLPRLGIVLLVAAATVALAPQLAFRQKTDAAPKNNGITGQVTLTLDPAKQLTIAKTKISGSPRNVTLEMHIHTDSCMGPKLFMARTPSNDAGKAAMKDQKFELLEGTTVPNKIPDNWWFNVHDTTRPDPTDSKKFVSIACGPVIVKPQGLRGTARLSPQPGPQPSPPTATPAPQSQTPPGDPKATQNTTRSVAFLQLDPNARTLSIQAAIWNAPPNITLEMHVHGDGSCKGPKLVMTQAPSDNAGNAAITNRKFDPVQETPLPDKIPNNWWFNIHDTTKPDPTDNKKFLSIACGPIQTIDTTTGFAIANPAQ